MSTAPEWKDPPPLDPVAGDEQFDGLNAQVIDFWRWGFSDLRLNVVRGVLAEFLVAKAVGATERPKVEWDSFDVKTPSGIRIEVKASAYWQSWPQRGPSKITFTGLTGHVYEESGAWSEERGVNADVFVFALQTCDEAERYDPLSVEQWAFWVLAAQEIVDHGGRSVGLAFVEARAERLRWEQLAEAIETCGEART